MNTDIRLSTNFLDSFQYLKFKKMCKGGLESLLHLMLRTAKERPKGVLGKLNGETIETMASWKGKKGVFFTAMVECEFLTISEEGVVSFLNWENEQNWCFHAQERTSKAKANGTKSKVRFEKQIASLPPPLEVQDELSIPQVPDIIEPDISGIEAPSPSPSPSPSLLNKDVIVNTSILNSKMESSAENSGINNNNKKALSSSMDIQEYRDTFIANANPRLALSNVSMQTLPDYFFEWHRGVCEIYESKGQGLPYELSPATLQVSHVRFFEDKTSNDLTVEKLLQYFQDVCLIQGHENFSYALKACWGKILSEKDGKTSTTYQQSGKIIHEHIHTYSKPESNHEHNYRMFKEMQEQEALEYDKRTGEQFDNDNELISPVVNQLTYQPQY